MGSARNKQTLLVQTVTIYFCHPHSSLFHLFRIFTLKISAPFGPKTWAARCRLTRLSWAVAATYYYSCSLHSTSLSSFLEIKLTSFQKKTTQALRTLTEQ